MSEMHYDYSKRSYLLPQGCKDLIDVLKLEKQHTEMQECGFGQSPLSAIWKLPKLSHKAEVAKGGEIQEVVISDKISIGEIALLVGEKPFKIIADLLKLGDFVSMNEEVSFDTAARLLIQYGFVAKRPG